MVAQLGRKESGKTALQIAIEKCNIEIIKLLVAIPEININMHSNYVEHYIWKNPEDNDEKKMKVFTVPNKKAPLHFAVEIKNISIIRLLLQQESIDIEITDNNEKKPIDYTKDDQILELFNKFNK